MAYMVKGSGRVRGGYVETPVHMERLLANCKARHEAVYTHINRSAHTGVKGRTADVTEWKHVLIDIDPMEPDADPVRAADQTLAALVKLGFDRAFTGIHSGRGVQMWLRVEWDARPFPKLDAERATAAFLAWLGGEIKLLHGCRIDTSCSDLARVARFPGSLNTKTGQEAFLFWAGQEAVSGPEFVYRWLPARELTHTVPIVESSNLPAIMPHLTNRAATFLTSGVATPGRHAAAYAAARSLFEMGTPLDLAKRWVIRGAMLCEPPLPADEAVRAVRSAFRRDELEAV